MKCYKGDYLIMCARPSSGFYSRTKRQTNKLKGENLEQFLEGPRSCKSIWQCNWASTLPASCVQRAGCQDKLVGQWKLLLDASKQSYCGPWGVSVWVTSMWHPMLRNKGYRKVFPMSVEYHPIAYYKNLGIILEPVLFFAFQMQALNKAVGSTSKAQPGSSHFSPYQI